MRAALGRHGRISFGAHHHDRHGGPHIRRSGVQRKLKARGHHADHLIALTIQGDISADDRRISGKPRLPQSVAQQDDACARLVVRGRKSAAQFRRSTQHGKHVGAEDSCAHVGWFPAACQRKRGFVICRHAVEQSRLVAQIGEIGITQRPVRFSVHGVGAPDGHQPLRLGKWQGLQQHRVQYAEDCRVRANSQRQRQYRNRSEAGTLRQHSQPVPARPATVCASNAPTHIGVPPSDRCVWRATPECTPPSLRR